MTVVPRAPRDRGATIPFVALALPVLILMVAFAVDLGIQRSNRRTMQARADIIALDLVRLADGRTEAQILADPTYLPALNGSAARNEVPVSALQVEYGTWDGVTFTPTFPDGVPTAVQVTARQTEDYFFQAGSGSVVRSAVATTDKVATLKLGSFAARVGSGGSPLLGSVLGDALNTSVVGYEGLLTSDIDLGLLATELGFGTPEEVLDSDVTVAELYHASAQALRNDPNSDADDLANANFFDAVGTSLTGTGSVQVGDVIGAEQGGEDAALAGTVNALDLFSAAALVANGENALAVPNLALAGGLAQVGNACNTNPSDDPTEVCSALTVVQGPVTFTTHRGGSRATKQARARIGASGGIPGLTVAATQIDVSLAPSIARLDDVTCADPRTVTASVSTGAADADVRIAGIISVLGYNVPVVINVSRPPSSAFESQVFTEQLDGTWDPDPFVAGTQDLGLSGVTPTITTDLSVLPPLLRATANGLVNGVLSATVLPFVAGPLLTAVDTAVEPLFNQLGLNLAGADLSALDALCELPKLVD